MITGEAAVVCFPPTTAEVAASCGSAGTTAVPFVPRGSGTGLAGGATPAGEVPPVVIVTTKMNRILEVDVEQRLAWVQPGVLNLDLSRAVAPLGLHFAPDPSSQQSCSVGGNLANNSGGPHCLLYGVTSAHILAVEVVLPDGDGGACSVASIPNPTGWTCGARSSAARAPWASPPASPCGSPPLPPTVATLLADFSDLGDAAAAVTGIIAAGIVPPPWR